MHVLHGGPTGSTYALYGAREPLLLPPVQFADEAAMHGFIEPYFQTPSQREVFRLALMIAQGTGALSGAGLFAQVMHALHIGVLRLAPVAVSGLQPVKTEPGRTALSGKPYVPPRRENPRPEPAPPEPRYKIALEIAGQNTQGLAGTLAISPADNPNVLCILPAHNQGSDTHRLECALSGLPNTPFSVWYRITMQGGAPMRLRLVEALQPVDQDAQHARWPTVLVPVLPLRHSAESKNIRADATRPAQGWIYIFVNGTLWRELQVVNAQGALRDVDLGAPDGVGDRRVARGQYTSQIVVPFQLAGAEQKVEMAYSRRQFTWAALMKLGGLAADDVRFMGAVKQDAANIAVDDALRKHLLQPIDLSSYGAGFDAQEGTLGPVAAALRPGGQQRDALFTWRSEAVPVAYLADRPVKKTVVNVIVGMGIFSARMENLNGGDLGPDVWDPDNKDALVQHYAKSKLSAIIGRDWSDDEINLKTARLHGAARVMNDYPPKLKADRIEEIKNSEHFQRRLRESGPNPDEDAEAEKEYQRRKARGWFGVLAEYAVLFEAIEAIEDEHFVFRVWAVGLDWRNDLAKAAAHLKQEIERIHAHTGYPELGTQGVHYEAGTHKVQVITHSQGSLIARYASEVLGARAMIQGVIHLNQPTTGAPALYRRFLGGARPERESWYKVSKLPDNVFAEILGTTSYHFTRMAGPMAGALSLLPTNDYVHRPGAKIAQWLHCPPRGLKPQVINDIYQDMYLDDSVGLISHKRYGAERNPKPYTAQEFMKVRFTKKVGAALEQTVSKAGGLLKEFILGQATAPREGDVKDFRLEEIPPDADYYLPEETPWHQDNMRLRPHRGMTEEEHEIADVWFKEFKNYLLMAQAFHAALGLKYHPSTYVIRSNGMNTVTQVQLLLTQDKNGDSVLDCPYERTKDGDGTVPLTSQEVLLTQGAKIIGPVITAGNVVHAKICEHTEAIKQAQAAIHVLVEELRPKDQDRLYVS